MQRDYGSTSSAMLHVEVVEDFQGPYFRLGRLAVHVNFQKRKKIGIKADLLARAIGYKRRASLKVWDVTAGLCRDSFHMACLGCEVKALEENETLFRVVNQHVRKLSSECAFELLHQEACEFLRSRLGVSVSAEDRPDVIYLDPMFPEKKKAAKSGKESELLKALIPVAPPEKEQELLDLALRVARQRVVVKRPLSAPSLLPLSSLRQLYAQPQIQFKGKAVRYDVYLIRTEPSRII